MIAHHEAAVESVRLAGIIAGFGVVGTASLAAHWLRTKFARRDRHGATPGAR